MPHWFSDTITMQILLDRYAGCRQDDWEKPEFLGGNIAALTERLDYLQWLGINCLWLSPFCKTDAYHGYHITDFFSVEPRFGTLEDLKRLIDESHRRGMRSGR